MTEEERKMVNEMCRRLGLVFEVWKEGVLVGRYMVVEGKIIKAKSDNLQNH